jgi:hypothetical protein
MFLNLFRTPTKEYILTRKVANRTVSILLFIENNVHVTLNVLIERVNRLENIGRIIDRIAGMDNLSLLEKRIRFGQDNIEFICMNVAFTRSECLFLHR